MTIEENKPEDYDANKLIVEEIKAMAKDHEGDDLSEEMGEATIKSEKDSITRDKG